MTMLSYFNYQTKEKVTYYPEGNLSQPQVIDAVVHRVPSTLLHGQCLRTVHLYLPRGTDPNQIASINYRTDTVLLKVLPFGAEEQCRILRVMASDPYIWKVQAYA